MSNRCPATIWGRHKYEARYDEKPDEVAADTIRRAIEARYKFGNMREIVRTYVQDVCLYCGDVIDRLEGKA